MKTFAKCRRGATAIEYGLIAGLFSIAMIVSLTITGDNTRTLYDSIATKLVTALTAIK